MMVKLFKVIFGVIAMAGIAVIGVAFWGMREIDRHAAMTPQERAAEQAKYAAKEAAFARQRMIDNEDGRMCLNGSGENAETVEQLKATLREPDSFEHISTVIRPVDASGNHDLVMRYRAKNGFGGTSFGRTDARVSNLDCSATIGETVSR